MAARLCIIVNLSGQAHNAGGGGARRAMGQRALQVTGQRGLPIFTAPHLQSTRTGTAPGRQTRHTRRALCPTRPPGPSRLCRVQQHSRDLPEAVAAAAATTAKACAPPPAMAPAAATKPAYRRPLPGERFFYGGLSCVISAVITNPMVRRRSLPVWGRRAAAAAARSHACPPAPRCTCFDALPARHPWPRAQPPARTSPRSGTPGNGVL